jgi:hypothetical protein
LGRKAIFQRHTPPLNLLGGYKFPEAPKVDLRPTASREEIKLPATAQPITDDLSIPALQRRNNVTNREFERLDRNERACDSPLCPRSRRPRLAALCGARHPA